MRITRCQRFQFINLNLILVTFLHSILQKKKKIIVAKNKILKKHFIKAFFFYLLFKIGSLLFSFLASSNKLFSDHHFVFFCQTNRIIIFSLKNDFPFYFVELFSLVLLHINIFRYLQLQVAKSKSISKTNKPKIKVN